MQFENRMAKNIELKRLNYYKSMSWNLLPMLNVWNNKNVEDSDAEHWARRKSEREWEEERERAREMKRKERKRKKCEGKTVK